MIAILDYEAGNLTSVELAVKQVGGEALVTQNPDEVRKASRIIFPGVGAAANCMENLKRLGLDLALKEAVASGKPVLAICIGYQLLFDHSEENDGVDCLGILPGRVTRFQFPESDHVKVPHMGWNEVSLKRTHPVLKHLKVEDPDKEEFYFVHSYYPLPADPAMVLTESVYSGITFCSGVGRDNLIATQFHPEKSGVVGLSILKNFLTWDGTSS